MEFPDVTISKLRFLEAEGLVEPQRTAAGYRKYSWDDVARLRYVLTAQRDQYLPLRVIREHLAEWDAGGVAPGRSRPTLVAVGPGGEVPGRARRSRPSRRRCGSAGRICWPVVGWTSRRWASWSGSVWWCPIRRAGTTATR